MININQIIKEMDLEGDPSNHRVVVAMSGGVDSSVTAALLVEAGFNVVGLTMQLYDYGKALQKEGACCAGSDINDARVVSSKLGIPHYVLNYESIFQDQVINDFADSYLRGETPIPCVRCNQTVKFTDMFDRAKNLGASAMATGHYIRRKTKLGNPSLHTGIDPSKDQSYFLFATTKKQLETLYSRLVKGGILHIDDYGLCPGVKKAVDEFFLDQKIWLHRVDITCRYLIKR